MPITPITVTKGIEHSLQVKRFYTELEKSRNKVPPYEGMAQLPQKTNEFIIDSAGDAKAFAESVRKFYAKNRTFS